MALRHAAGRHGHYRPRPGGGGGSGFGGDARKFYNKQFAQMVKIPQATMDFVNQVQSFTDPKGPIPQLIRLQEEMGYG